MPFPQSGRNYLKGIVTLRWTRFDADEVILDRGEMRCRVEANTIERLGALPWRPTPSARRIHLELSEAETRLAENVYWLQPER